MSTESTPSAPKKPRNAIGIAALAAAVVGFIFACIPGALIVGWVLLPIAFILSLVSLFLRGKPKGMGVTALILSIVGTIVGFVVFFSVLATGIDDAFSGGETSISAPVDSADADAASDDASDAEEPEEAAAGTRGNPVPLGSEITQGDWAVTVNSVNLDAGAAIAEANMFNDPAPEGSVYLLANVTATYIGDDEAGEMPMLSLEYVTPGGNTVAAYEAAVVAPEMFDQSGTLYPGASTTGNFVFTTEAADAAEGTIAVTPHLFGDKVFVAVK